MRLVVLLCGVVAGIIGLGFGWWGYPSGMVDIYHLPTPLFAAAVIAIHTTSVVSIAGGLVVLAVPRIGGMMMLASAMIWLTLVAVMGGGLSVSMASLIAIGGAGGLLAFLPSLNRAIYRLAPADTLDEAPRVIEDAKQKSEPEPEPAQDEPDEWPGVVYTTTAEYVPEREQPRPRLGDEDLTDHFGSGYQIHQGQIRPVMLKRRRKRGSRARALAGLTSLAVLLIGLPSLMLIDYQMKSTTIAHRTDAEEPEPAPAEVAPVEVAPAEIVAAEPALVDIPAEAPAVEVAETPVEQVPEIVVPPTVAQVSGLIESRREAEPEFAALPMPSTRPLYETPFDYCADVREADMPKQELIGNGLPQELMAGVRQVTNMPDAEIFWRCMSSAVWVCAQPANGVECRPVPTRAERSAFCQANPGTRNIISAGGVWHCDGMFPLVTPEQQATDARGFDRRAWLALTKTPVEGEAP